MKLAHYLLSDWSELIPQGGGMCEVSTLSDWLTPWGGGMGEVSTLSDWSELTPWGGMCEVSTLSDWSEVILQGGDV